MVPTSSPNGSRRFQFRWLYVVLFLLTIVAFGANWWSGLVGGIELFSSREISTWIRKPFGWSGDDWSREDDELLMQRGGAELKAKIESSLFNLGFVRAELQDADSPDRFVGTYLDSPPIQLKLVDGVGITEAGIHYQIFVDYSLQLPRSSVRYQIRMAELIKRFENELQSMLNNCCDDLLSEHPEYR